MARKVQNDQNLWKMIDELADIEFIANALYGGDVVLSNFFSHFSNMHINRSCQHVDIRPPDVLKEFVSIEDLVGILR